MASPLVRVERAEHAWTLTLDRAEKANALSSELVEALIAAVDEAHAARVPVIAFRGAGRNFSAGFDFGDYEAQSEGDLVHRFVRIETLLQGVASSPSRTVAFAHGRNFGAGVDLFATCRVRITAPEATFRMPGLAFGVVLGTRRFAAIVGTAKAHEVLSNLATFNAAEAQAMGFARIAGEDEWDSLLAEAVATARKLPDYSRAALAQVLKAADDDADMAALVRSVSAPGLKGRIAAYLAASRGVKP